MSTPTWACTTITWPRCWPWTCTRSWGTGRLPVDLRWMMSFRPGLTTQVTAAPLGLQGALLSLLPGSAPWQQSKPCTLRGTAVLLRAIWHSNSQALPLCNCSAKYFKSQPKKKKKKQTLKCVLIFMQPGGKKFSELCGLTRLFWARLFQSGYVMFCSTSMKARGSGCRIRVNITVFIFTLAISKWPN